MLMPMPLDDETRQALAEHYRINIVEIDVHDWDDALTPWPEPGVMPHDPPFKGLAAQTLSQIKTEIIPQVEKTRSAERYLLGISLSGLFAVWAWMQDDTFSAIASISGSFWYDNFTQWLAQNGRRPLDGRAYLSLGDREGDTHIRRFKPVVADTAEVEKLLRQFGAEVKFESTQGTHYAPMLPRIVKALDFLAI